MAGFIKPVEDRGRDDTLLMSTGWHVAQCIDVVDAKPSDKWANAKPRLVFEFREYDPRSGTTDDAKAVFICTASVFAGNAKMPASQLFKFAQQVGYRNPEKGINTNAWKGRFFAVYVRNNGNAAYVELHSPCGEPEGDTLEDREAWVSLAIQSSPHHGREQTEEQFDNGELPF